MHDETQRSPQLFTLRVWPEIVNENRTEWRGKVQHIASGETRYFRSWDALVDFLRSALGESASEHKASAPRKED